MGQKKMKLILASASLRRRELLGLLGIPFEVQTSGFDETSVPTAGLTPSEWVQRLAQGKAHDVAMHVEGDALVIGADTTVTLDGKYFNKPQDAEDAALMLRALSGRTHEVHTGLCLMEVMAGHLVKTVTDATTTQVTFDTLTEETIAAYIATGEPLDKAGAYGIQGKALTFIPGIAGDYFNVVGLPVFLLCQTLLQFGISPWP
jgi:septum formation protein